MPSSKKQLRSIMIMLAVAVLATAGFLLVMGRLSASDTPVAGSDEYKADTPVAVEFETEANVPNAQRQPTPLLDEVNLSTSAEPTSPEDIITTVNNQIIARDAWQQATRFNAAMSRWPPNLFQTSRTRQVGWSMGFSFARL